MKRAIVLSGGGARGAYEVGVLKYIFTEFQKESGLNPKFEILCGTSVGAIHTAFLSSYIKETGKNIKILEKIWLGVKMENLMEIKIRNAVNLIFPFIKGNKGLFTVDYLNRIISLGINWKNIDRNIDDNIIDAVCIFATQISTGKTVAFINTKKMISEWKKDPFMDFSLISLLPKHVLASAAIPVIFQPVNIDGKWYCDGGIRLNTPLSPAIRLGADKILSVVVRYYDPQEHPEREKLYPSFVYILGKILNALFLDRIAYETSRLEVINKIVELIMEQAGSNRFSEISSKVAEFRGYALRKVDLLTIRPSQDIGIIANECGRVYSKIPLTKSQMLIRVLLEMSPGVDTDLISYILFEPKFANELIKLGYEDAKRQSEALYRFFS